MSGQNAVVAAGMATRPRDLGQVRPGRGQGAAGALAPADRRACLESRLFSPAAGRVADLVSCADCRAGRLQHAR
jgi:hypothetical protein